MTLLLLVRHATTDAVGQRLTGRMTGIPLNAQGRAQAARLGARLAALPLRAIYSSPLERALDTAREVATAHGLIPRTRPGLTDIDFGAWTGESFASLGPRAEWAAFNTRRSGTRPPAGEHIAEVQARMVAELLSVSEEHPQELVAVVGHADPLRAALAFFLGIPCDLAQRLEIAPASLSVLRLLAGDALVLRLNDTGAELPELHF